MSTFKEINYMRELMWLISIYQLYLNLLKPLPLISLNKYQCRKAFLSLKILPALIPLVFVNFGMAQSFQNPDLNGAITGISVLPTFWQNVPASDINCHAFTPGVSDTPDLTDTTGPDNSIGLNGNPYSGNTFVSGLQNNFHHEGIMQEVTGFTIDNWYVIKFYQSMVKQDRSLDTSASWAVFIDNTMAGVTLPTVSQAAYNSNNFIWEPRKIYFRASEQTHTIKFLPRDDDRNLSTSNTNLNGSIRVGIDHITLELCSLAADIGSDTTMCEGEELKLDATTPGASYMWIDNSTGSTFDVNKPGVYWVQLIAGNCITSDTIHVDYIPDTPPDLGNDTIICNGNSLALNANDSMYNSYLWQDGSTDSIFIARNEGYYWVNTIIDKCQFTDSIYISVADTPVVNLGIDTSICLGDTLVLNASNNLANYLWQDNSTNPIYNVTEEGKYQVTVNIDNCIGTDAVSVVVIPIPEINLGKDTTLCDQANIVLNATTKYADYRWQNNSNNPVFEVTDGGQYWVEVTTNCGRDLDSIRVSIKDCDCSIYIPNSFTPNGDKLNDNFHPIPNCELTDYHLSIFNRWGELLFKTNNLSEKWEGQFDGHALNVDTYVYRITYSTKSESDIVRQGTVRLLR